jgi:ankyrin repeat protein
MLQPNLWDTAVSALSEVDRVFLTSNINETSGNISDILGLVKERQSSSFEKRWKFKKPSGEVVIVRDLLEKIVQWLQKFKDVGDVVNQYTPGYAALPWVGVRVLLQVSTNDIETFGAIAEGVDAVSRLMVRCSVYENMYMRVDLERTTATQELLIKSLAALYIATLTYLANAGRYYQQSTAKGVVTSIAQPISNVEGQFDQVLAHEREVERLVQIRQGEMELKLDSAISTLPVSNEARIQSLQSLRQSFEQPLVRTIGTLAQFEQNLQNGDRTQLLRWLSTVDYRQYHDAVFHGMVPGTGNWLFQHLKYKQWQESSLSKILWIHGIPGCGKSKICSLAIQKHLEQVSKDPNTAPVAYFYCSKVASESFRADPKTILSSILRQLSYFQEQDQIHHTVLAEFQQRLLDSKSDGLDLTPLSLEECTRMIIGITFDYPVTIIVDGLDEIDQQASHVLESLNSIVEQSSNIVKVVVSSRDDSEVSRYLKDAISIRCSDVNNNSKDIAAVVNDKVEAAIRGKRLLGGRVSDALRESIISTLTEGAGSTFLWPCLHLEQLCNGNMFKLQADVEAALKSAPPGLRKTFDQIYNCINHYPDQTRVIIKRIFSWLLVAERPLSKVEVLCAASFGYFSNQPNFDEVNILDQCSSFLLHNKALESFSFAHASIYEYLESLPEFSLPLLNFAAATQCLEYLMVGYYETEEVGELVTSIEEHSANLGSNSISIDIKVRSINQSSREQSGNFKSKSSFHSYATVYWPRHYTKVAGSLLKAQLDEKMLEFTFGNDGMVFSIWLLDVEQFIRERKLLQAAVVKELAEVNSESQSSLFLASVYGISNIFERLAKSEDKSVWESKNANGASPVYITSRFGRVDALRQILERNAAVDINGGYFGLPIQAAAFHGHYEIVKILIERGADPTKSAWLPTALHAALSGGHISTIGQLLKDKAFTTLSDFDNILARAAYGGQYEAVCLLLNRQVPIAQTNTICQFNHDALQAALYRGRPRIAIELLKQMQDINSAGGYFGNALQAAALGGKVAMIQLVLDSGANVNLSGHYGTALRAASFGGHDDVVRLLLQRGAKIKPSDVDWHPDALEAAASQGRLSTVKLLLGNIDFARLGRELEVAIKSASLCGFPDVVRYLLQNGASSFVGQALEGAITGGHEDILDIIWPFFPDSIPNYCRYTVVNCEIRPMFHFEPIINDGNEPDYDSEYQLSPTPLEKNFFAQQCNPRPSPPSRVKIPGVDLECDWPNGRRYLPRLAAIKGTKKTVEALLSRDIDIGKVGTKILELAAFAGNLEVVRLMLNREVKIGRALHGSVRANREDIVGLILSKFPNIDPDPAPDTQKPMHHSQSKSETPNISDLRKLSTKTPLALAVGWNRLSLVKILLEHKKTLPHSEPGIALNVAAQFGRKEMVELILGHFHEHPTTVNTGLQHPIFLAALGALSWGYVDSLGVILKFANEAKLVDNMFVLELIRSAVKFDKLQIGSFIQEMFPEIITAEEIAGVTMEAIITKESFSDEDHKEILRLMSAYSTFPSFAPFVVQALYEAIKVSKCDLGISILQDHVINQGLKFDTHILHEAIYRHQDLREHKSNKTEKSETLIRLLVDNGADVNSADTNGITPLYRACYPGNFDIFQILIDAGADINTRYKSCHHSARGVEDEGQTTNLLQITLSCSQYCNSYPGYYVNDLISIVCCLVDHGLTREVNDPGFQILIDLVSSNGSLEMVQKLLQCEAKLSAASGSTSVRNELCGVALLASSASGQKNIVTYLLEQGVDPNGKHQRPHLEPYSGFGEGRCATAIQEAVDLKDWKPAPTASVWETCQLILSAGANQAEGQLFLRKAAEYGNEEIVEWALKTGIVIEEFPLCKSINAIGLLVKCGMSTNTPPGRAEDLQKLAAESGLTDTLEFLTNLDGPLMSPGAIVDMLISRKKEEWPKLLNLLRTHYGHDINNTFACTGRECNGSQLNILFKACIRKEVDLVIFLLRNGADSDCPGLPRTPLTLLSRAAHWIEAEEGEDDSKLKMVQLLLKHGADVNGDGVARGHPLYTPLLFAIASKFATTAELLINNDADVNRGVVSPLNLALWTQQENIAKLLRQHGAVTRDYSYIEATDLDLILRKYFPGDKPSLFYAEMDEESNMCWECGEQTLGRERIRYERSASGSDQQFSEGGTSNGDAEEEAGSGSFRHTE